MQYSLIHQAFQQLGRCVLFWFQLGYSAQEIEAPAQGGVVLAS